MSQISTDGPLARTTADAALMLQVMAGPDERDATALRDAPPDFAAAADSGSVQGLRIAWTTELMPGTPCEDAVAANLRRAAAALADAGAEMAQVAPEIPDPLEIFPVLSATGAAANYGNLAEGREEELTRYAASSILRGGKRISGVQAAEAYAGMDLLQGRMAEFFSRFDVLLTPTSAITAHEHGARIDEIAGVPVNPWAISILYTPIANLLQAPAISVPSGFDEDGLPTAVQVLAARGRDETVIRCGAALERAMPWGGRRPALQAATHPAPR